MSGVAHCLRNKKPFPGRRTESGSPSTDLERGQDRNAQRNQPSQPRRFAGTPGDLRRFPPCAMAALGRQFRMDSVAASRLGHVLAYSSAVFRYGHEAVMVFFALSGFFIHLRVAKAGRGRRGPRRGWPVLRACTSPARPLYRRVADYDRTRLDRPPFLSRALWRPEAMRRWTAFSPARTFPCKRSCRLSAFCPRRWGTTSARTARCGRWPTRWFTTCSIRTGVGFASGAAFWRMASCRRFVLLCLSSLLRVFWRAY